MKEYEKNLQSLGYNIIYIPSNDNRHDIRVLLSGIKDEYEKFIFIDPVDTFLERRIKKELESKNI